MPAVRVYFTIDKKAFYYYIYKELATRVYIE